MDEKTIFEFVTAWWKAKSIADVCEAFNIDRRYASNLAAQMRRRGIPLKNLNRGTQIHTPVKGYNLMELRQHAERLADADAAELARAKASQFGGSR